MRLKSILKHTKCILFLSLLGIIVLILTRCNSSVASDQESNDDSWELVKTANNEEASWIIYSRKIAGTDLLEYKIEGQIESSPKQCLSAFKQDIHELASASVNKKYPVYDILKNSEDGLLTYVVHNEPFPFRDTEMCTKYDFYVNKDGSTGVSWREAWEEESVPSPSKKLSRVQSFRGSWRFIISSDNESKAANTVQFDPKNMPMWLVEPMVFKFLKSGLRNIREMTSVQ